MTAGLVNLTDLLDNLGPLCRWDLSHSGFHLTQMLIQALYGHWNLVHATLRFQHLDLVQALLCQPGKQLSPFFRRTSESQLHLLDRNIDRV